MLGPALCAGKSANGHFKRLLPQAGSVFPAPRTGNRAPPGAYPSLAVTIQARLRPGSAFTGRILAPPGVRVLVRRRTVPLPGLRNDRRTQLRVRGEHPVKAAKNPQQ